MRSILALVLFVLTMTPSWATYARDDFCNRHPQECAINLNEPDRVQFTRRLYMQLSAVTRHFNRTLRERSDRELYGIEDHWAFPTKGYGDCEDYQLAKRRALRTRGIPHRAMRIAIVYDSRQRGHAVLVIRTTAGDLVLDNHNSHVLTPGQTGHNFLLIESSHDGGLVRYTVTVASK
jgi:predicted transglutaminase-like cysteine proteinase